MTSGDHPTQSNAHVTILLQRYASGDRAAADDLIPLVYDELRRLASSYLRRERRGQTLEPTGLVNEAWLKLMRQGDAQFQNRAHFFAIAAGLMRQILVDSARRKHASKRNALQRADFEEASAGEVAVDAGPLEQEQRLVDLLAIDAALTKLKTFDEAQARLVELRFFGGLTNEEVASVEGVSLATVKREWSAARAWLTAQLRGRSGPGRAPGVSS